MNYPTSAELKVNRAEEHLKLLNQETIAYLGTPQDPATSTDHDFEPKGNGEADWVFRVRIHRPPPPRLSVIIGDILSNLRSSLDHLAHQLAIHNVGLGGDLHGMEFPIFSDQAEYSRLDRKGNPVRGSGLYKVRSIGPQPQAIIERLQPYHRGNDYARDPLWRLHYLRRIDQHRTLNIVQPPIGRISPAHDVPGLRINSVERFRPCPLVDGAIFMICHVTILEGGEVTVKQQIPPHIAFEEGSPVDDLYAGEALQEIVDYIRNTVFSKLYAPDLWK